jgi:hypothetical protein
MNDPSGTDGGDVIDQIGITQQDATTGELDSDFRAVTSCSSSSASVATADVALMLAALGMVVGHRPLRRLFARLVSPRAAGAGA